MVLVGSASSASINLFRDGIQRKLVVTGLRPSNRNSFVYACRPGQALSQAQLDVINKARGNADVRGYHMRRALEHIAEVERLDSEERSKKD